MHHHLSLLASGLHHTRLGSQQWPDHNCGDSSLLLPANEGEDLVRRLVQGHGALQVRWFVCVGHCDLHLSEWVMCLWQSQAT